MGFAGNSPPAPAGGRHALVHDLEVDLVVVGWLRRMEALRQAISSAA
jgi:hypothetical protein